MPTILNQRWPAKARSLPEARRATIDALTQAGVVDRRLLSTIALAVSEAVGNAIHHAYPDDVGDIDLKVDNDTCGISITVADTGVGISRPAHERGLGLGLQLIGTLATTYTLDSDSTGTTVTLRFNPNAEPPSPERAMDVHGDPETPI